MFTLQLGDEQYFSLFKKSTEVKADYYRLKAYLDAAIITPEKNRIKNLIFAAEIKKDSLPYFSFKKKSGSKC